MPSANPQGISLVIRGDEVSPIQLQSYGDFCRDLVFVHDRLWFLVSQDERFASLYFSNWFYTRSHQRVAEGSELCLNSARIGSPFELNVNVNVGEWAEGVADALLKLLRGIITLPEYRRNRRLQNDRLEIANQGARLTNRQLQAEVKLRERALAAVPTEQAAAAEMRNRDLNFLLALPGMHGDDRDAKFRLLMNDVHRLAGSELIIQEVHSSTESAGSRDEKQ